MSKLTASLVKKYQQPLERFEGRVLMSVSLDPTGWTLVAPDANSRVIYVSSTTGEDKNSGQSPNSPVASLAKAFSLVRDGSSDQLLLKAGDSWTTGFPQWTKSGQDTQHPMFIGAYGTGARPLLLTGAVSSAFSTAGAEPIDHLVISDLQFRSDVRDPASPNYQANAGKYQYSGFRWYAPTSGFTLQDCSFQYYSDNLDIEGVGGGGAVNNPNLFRCQSLYSYNNSGGKFRSQGLYSYQATGLQITQCLFDHNGWLPDSMNVSGAGANGYDHDIYLTASVTGSSIQENIIANASNNGLLARGGGDIENNLFIDNPSHIAYGASPGSTSAVGGVHGNIIGNVFIGDLPEGTTSSYGMGITLSNTAPGTPTLIADNIFTGQQYPNGSAISFASTSGTKNPQDCVGINDVVVQENLFNDVRRAINLQGDLVPGGTGVDGINNVSIRDNNFQNAGEYLVRYDTPLSNDQIHFSGNNYYRASGGNLLELENSVPNLARWRASIEPDASNNAPTFPNASASPATYNAALGSDGTTASFLAAAAAQSFEAWNPSYLANTVNDFIRTGFGIAPAPVAAATAPSITMSSGVSPSAEPTANGGYTFNVTYADTQSLNFAGIASGNVSVIGPNDFNQPASLVSVAADSDGKSASATYSITPPNGKWGGAGDGQYTIMMQPDQVRNTSGIAVPQGAIGNFHVSLPLVIDGTEGKDRIKITAALGQLLVRINGQSSSHTIADIPQLQIYGHDGNDFITVGPGVPASMVDGGAGNDHIVAKNGNDTVFGSDGNDFLTASGGHNLMFGGIGNDHLASNSKNSADLLDGGSGNDMIRAGRGDNILIAGAGSDRLHAGAGLQLLIAGSASTEDPAGLNGLLMTWSTAADYSARIAAFSSQPITFTADSGIDVLNGSTGPDYFIASATTRVRHKLLSETIMNI